MDGWYAVMTKPNSERFAELALQEASRGFTVYNPKVLRRVSHAGRVMSVARPFLPRYILVLADGRGVRGVRTAPGVAGVVCLGDRPALVRQSEIDAIKAREIVVLVKGKEERYVDLGGPALATDTRQFKTNELVRIGGGPFVGFNALFQCRDDAQRAFVFMDILGRKSRLSIELEHIEKL